MSASAEFDTTVLGIGNNTGIVVPPEVLDALGAGKRPAVTVNVNGYEYASTVGVMKGQAMISISSAIRKETGLAADVPIHVVLTLADGPREVVMHEDFTAALAAEPAAQTFFTGLSNSLQRYHADLISGAKTAETRARRIEKAVGLFLAGKSR